MLILRQNHLEDGLKGSFVVSVKMGKKEIQLVEQLVAIRQTLMLEQKKRGLVTKKTSHLQECLQEQDIVTIFRIMGDVISKKELKLSANMFMELPLFAKKVGPVHEIDVCSHIPT